MKEISKNSISDKNLMIEILRGFLILMIVFYHYTFRFSELYQIKTVDFITLGKWGIMGVGGFFIISGYFMIPKSLSHFHIFPYLKKKISRLYPSYFLALILIFSIIFVFTLPNREVTFLTFLANVFLINVFFDVGYVDGAHWYLMYLIAFYIIISIFIKLVYQNKSKNKTLYLLFLLLFKDVLKVVSHFIAPFDILYAFIGKDFLEFLIIGLVLRLLFLNQGKVRENLLLLLFCLLHVTVLKGFFVSIFILLFISVFWIILLNPKQDIKEKFFLYNGKVSFQLYLIHQNLGYLILINLTEYFCEFHLWFILLTYIIMLFFSSIIYYYYECKLQKILKKCKVRR